MFRADDGRCHAPRSRARPVNGRHGGSETENLPAVIRVMDHKQLGRKLGRELGNPLGRRLRPAVHLAVDLAVNLVTPGSAGNLAGNLGTGPLPGVFEFARSRWSSRHSTTWTWDANWD